MGKDYTVKLFILTTHSQNVLIVRRPPDRWSVKVCDLGLSKRVEQAAGGNASTSIHFSPGYCPPEKNSIYDNHENIDGYKADMWCLGELVVQTLTGKPSFKNAKDLYTWCQTGQGYPDQLLRDLAVSEGAIDFLHSVMACDPAARPTAQVACEHRWWAEPDIRPRREQPASILRRSGRISRRSAPDVRYPVSRRPQSYVAHDTWNSAALPYPKGLSDDLFCGASGPSNPQIYPLGMYQHPYATSATHLPMGLYAPHQPHLESDYVVDADIIVNRGIHGRGLPYDPRSSKAPHHVPNVLRQQGYHRQRRAQIASGSVDGPHEPPQHDRNLLKQVRFEPGLRDRSQASPEQGADREGRAQITPVQRKGSVPDKKGLRTLFTLGDLRIGTDSDQPVQIRVHPINKKSKKRPQTSQVIGEAATSGASFGEGGGLNSYLDNVPREEQIVQFKRADAQLRGFLDQLSRKEVEISGLKDMVARFDGTKGNAFYRGVLANKIGEAVSLREAADRLREDMFENARFGQPPPRAVTWQRTQAESTEGNPSTGGEDLENRGDPSWPWLGDGGWTEELPAFEDVRQQHVGLVAR